MTYIEILPPLAITYNKLIMKKIAYTNIHENNEHIHRVKLHILQKYIKSLKIQEFKKDIKGRN